MTETTFHVTASSTYPTMTEAFDFAAHTATRFDPGTVEITVKGQPYCPPSWKPGEPRALRYRAQVTGKMRAGESIDA